MPLKTAVEKRSLGDLKSELRALKKRHDSLYEEHQKCHREFMEYGTGGLAERKRLYSEGRKLDEEAEEILQAAQLINEEVDERNEEQTTGSSSGPVESCLTC